MSEPDLTHDQFLGGRLRAWQPRSGYRAGVDAVFLAAAVPAKPGDTILELGCGVGVASLCLAARVSGVHVTGIELQPDYAALARRNAVHNDLAIKIVTGDLTQLPAEIRQQTFDHVMANPPYFERGKGVAAADPGREVAFGEGTPIADWVETATRRLSPKGQLTMIVRVERMMDVLAALDHRMGSIEIQPLSARQGRRAKLILLRAIKCGRAPASLLSPVVLHEGPQHLTDADDYAAQIAGVLRFGREFPWQAG